MESCPIGGRETGRGIVGWDGEQHAKNGGSVVKTGRLAGNGRKEIGW